MGGAGNFQNLATLWVVPLRQTTFLLSFLVGYSISVFAPRINQHTIFTWIRISSSQT